MWNSKLLAELDALSLPIKNYDLSKVWVKDMTSSVLEEVIYKKIWKIKGRQLNQKRKV